MKLYVWNDVYGVPYGGSCLYVMAPNLREARKLALTAVHAEYGSLGRDVKTLKLEDLGEPTRVYDGPVAEVYEWSE